MRAKVFDVGVGVLGGVLGCVLGFLMALWYIDTFLVVKTAVGASTQATGLVVEYNYGEQGPTLNPQPAGLNQEAN